MRVLARALAQAHGGPRRHRLRCRPERPCRLCRRGRLPPEWPAVHLGERRATSTSLAMSTREAVPALPARPSSARLACRSPRRTTGHVDIARDVDLRGRASFAGAAVFRPIGLPFTSANGGPEGKLRGRPPPLVEPRSGPWRRTGSESGAGRAQTRRCEYDERNVRPTRRRETQIAAICCNFCKRRCTEAFVAGGRHVSASSRSENVG
jgi:hypothetical protein